MELQDFIDDWNEKIRIESAREDVLNNALMVNEVIRNDIAGLGHNRYIIIRTYCDKQ